jgi:hypothetical protein
MKDRIEWFDECYPCIQIECNFLHGYNWKQLFVSMYIDTIINNGNNFELVEEMNTILLTEPFDALVLSKP